MDLPASSDVPLVDVDVDVAVIGAGLAGLAAAVALQPSGAEVRVLEARERPGGRAHSLPVDGGTVELGATWFWSGEPLLAHLTSALHLPVHPQDLTGDALYDTGQAAPQRLQGNPLDMESSRLLGGFGGLADALVAQLPEGTVRLGHPVEALEVVREDGGPAGSGPEGVGGAAHVVVRSPAGTLRARQVILAVPPALALEQLRISPQPAPALRELAATTPVWMGRMIKAVALFESAFWRGRGLAGAAISHVGPFRVMHDHSGPEGTPAALFGFAPAAGFGDGPRDDAQLTEAFTAQLTRLFGPDAAQPLAVHVMDWSRERFTQPQAPADGVQDGFGALAYQEPLHGVIHWASTETATAFAGHAEGAVLAGRRAALATGLLAGA